MISTERKPKHRAEGKAVTLLDDVVTGVRSVGKRSAGIALTSGVALAGFSAPMAAADDVPETPGSGSGSNDLNNLRNTLKSDTQVATFKVSALAKWNIDEVEFEVKELPPPPPPEPVVQTETQERASNDSSRSLNRGPAPEQSESAPEESNWDGTVSGSNVVEIARSLVGLPYVAGGASPSSGFDCSGLVSYVYAQMGKSLPRSSGAIRNAGTVVSDPQPGDIVWTPGHVAIYAGNGVVIEAGTPRTGVIERGMWQSNPTYLRF